MTPERPVSAVSGSCAYSGAEARSFALLLVDAARRRTGTIPTKASRMRAATSSSVRSRFMTPIWGRDQKSTSRYGPH